MNKNDLHNCLGREIRSDLLDKWGEEQGVRGRGGNGRVERRRDAVEEQ